MLEILQTYGQTGFSMAIVILLLVGFFKFGKDVANKAVEAYQSLIAGLIKQFIAKFDDVMDKVDALVEHVDKLDEQIDKLELTVSKLVELKQAK